MAIPVSCSGVFREAVDLAIAGAGKVIERNLDSDANRKLVESFLGSVTLGGKA